MKSMFCKRLFAFATTDNRGRKMKKTLAALAATLTISLSTGASAELAFIVDVPNNSVANEALGRAASRPSCDDPFVAQVCARSNLFTAATRFSSETAMSFNQSISRSAVDGGSAVGAVVDRGDLYVFESRSSQVETFFPRSEVDLEAPPEFEGENVLENPLPAAAPILFGGLAALGLLARRRRAA